MVCIKKCTMLNSGKCLSHLHGYPQFPTFLTGKPWNFLSSPNPHINFVQIKANVDVHTYTYTSIYFLYEWNHNTHIFLHLAFFHFTFYREALCFFYCYIEFHCLNIAQLIQSSPKDGHWSYFRYFYKYDCNK